jgi:hypothetical protein
MKKFLKHILLFCTFTIAVYLVLLVIWGGFCPQFLRKNMIAPQGLHYSYERLQEAKTTTDIDILFLGSSRTYRGFDTRIFQKAGYKTFNLGTSSQTFLQTEILLKRYLQQMNPKLVVMDLAFDAFESEGMESAMDIVANDTIDKYAWKMIKKYCDIRLYNTMLYAAFWNFTRKNNLNWGIDTFQKNLYAKLKGADTYILGGYVEKELIYFQKHNYKDTQLEFNKEMFSAFERCLDLCRQNNCNVLLVQVPYTQGYYNSISNGKDFDAKINSYAVPYYNFNYLLPLDDVLHFYDAVHLNQLGAELFSTKLAHKIDSLEVLKETSSLE